MGVGGIYLYILQMVGGRPLRPHQVWEIEEDYVKVFIHRVNSFLAWKEPFVQPLPQATIQCWGLRYPINIEC